MTEQLSNCPLCKGSALRDFLNVTDHFLTKEQFIIQVCNTCGFKFVNPRPSESKIGAYYHSDEYISHDTNRKNLLTRVYKIARQVSIHYKYAIIRDNVSGRNLLDIGCGTGELLAYCKAKDYTVMGVEPSEKARQFARETNGIDVVEHLKMVPGKSGYFHGITLWHVLEHIHKLTDTMEIIGNLLAPDGTLIIAVPNSNSYDAAHYREYWAAYDVPRHLYHFTEKTVGQFAANHGYDVIQTLPQKLDAYYVAMLSEKYRRKKNNYLLAMLTGFISNLKGKSNGRGHSSQIFILRRTKATF